MPSGSEVLDFLTQSILENEKRKKKNLYGDRLLGSPTKLPVAGEEKPKASDILMLLASGIMNPGGTALGLAEGALRPESSIFDNEIPLPEGGYMYPEKTESLSFKGKMRTKFTEAFRQNYSKIQSENPNLPEDYIKAEAFMRTRYPKIMDAQKVTGGQTKTPKALGEYDASTNEIRATILPNQTTPDYTETLGHEVGHSIRSRRLGKGENLKDKIQNWGKFYDAQNKLEGYKTNVEELAAKQSGRTAKLNYAEFIKEFREAESIQQKREVLNSYIQDTSGGAYNYSGNLLYKHNPRTPSMRNQWNQELSSQVKPGVEQIGSTRSSIWQDLLNADLSEDPAIKRKNILNMLAKFMTAGQ